MLLWELGLNDNNRESQAPTPCSKLALVDQTKYLIYVGIQVLLCCLQAQLQHWSKQSWRQNMGLDDQQAA